jgi:hypothetical protein
MNNHHPLIDYTKCYDCKFNLPEHEAFKDQGKDYCNQCYNKLLELYYRDKYKL